MTEDKAAVAEKPAGKSAKKKEAPQSKGQLVHHVVRTISKATGATGGAWSLSDIEEYIAQYTMAGWELFATHYLGEVPEGYSMLWVLTKQQ